MLKRKGRRLKFFSSLRGTKSVKQHINYSEFFWLNTLKNTAKVPAVDIFTQKALTGNKQVIFWKFCFQLALG